jgi:hypothetical protein
MLTLSETNAGVLLSRINKKRDQFSDSPTFLAIIDSMNKELEALQEFTEDELEWIHIATGIFDDDRNQAKVDFDEIRRKVRKQIYKIRNPYG